MTQNERLTYLVEEFKADSGEYRDLQTPPDVEGQREVLRSLMNIRMPRGMSSEVLEVQDKYLQERARRTAPSNWNTGASCWTETSQRCWRSNGKEC